MRELINQHNTTNFYPSIHIIVEFAKVARKSENLI